MKNELKITDTSIEEKIKRELKPKPGSERDKIFSKFFSAALGGIPWVGGFLSILTDLHFDDQSKNNILYEKWLEEHQNKMRLLGETLFEVVKKLNEFSEDINERLESEEYLQIVRKSFRTWDNADTFEKRELIRKLITNAGGQKIVDDDIIRLFLDWLNLYHEIHFSVIKVIYQNQSATRGEIWQELNGTYVREDSMEADLFKMLIRDLSTGGVIRQYRPTDYYGNFVKQKRTKAPSSGTLKSAFDDQEQYVLTSLGQNFVHYTMNELNTKIG
ncbi:hypothetical protein [Flavobacterium johnsoniae]|uniref:DUF4393 domain-containing protein n=1 Tax=Flavobacterium johnsoniae (strain ATCC 17061 / DSM 2064 / JCM 8514 / BCRC 14874 / CCUG 350202 / NBRC 14942 / NCIMB 11054 / UW101) TaxID=376686 RepID=A5FBW8_FLAJ1|nr:hypothetical protein [Flavobacterium johnsoniae]ABQ07295.1 hypothetical protein Fjoh_4287 [Flavobacterium johnsoniae UW101]OXE94963.1 hypothetical protein B0A63_26060 [Flavobacterium johnsoniae UW101]WQG80870.1 hypothetical protein SR927_23005 [Flavobacterium johnsoniae UW101]SHL17374.1 hypothetical protein SAMN05444146_3224 [Flavobacterium johnsoniae]